MAFYLVCVFLFHFSFFVSTGNIFWCVFFVHRMMMYKRVSCKQCVDMHKEYVVCQRESIHLSIKKECKQMDGTDLLNTLSRKFVWFFFCYAVCVLCSFLKRERESQSVDGWKIKFIGWLNEMLQLISNYRYNWPRKSD